MSQTATLGRLAHALRARLAGDLLALTSGAVFAFVLLTRVIAPPHRAGLGELEGLLSVLAAAVVVAAVMRSRREVRRTIGCVSAGAGAFALVASLWGVDRFVQWYWAARCGPRSASACVEVANRTKDRDQARRSLVDACTWAELTACERLVAGGREDGKDEGCDVVQRVCDGRLQAPTSTKRDYLCRMAESHCR